MADEQTPEPKRKPLNARERRFVREFVRCGNATKAAERAGYKAKRLDQAGYQVLRKAEIREAVDERRKALFEELDVDAEMIATELARCGFANMADYMTVGKGGDPVLDFSKLTRDHAAALTEVTVDTYMDGGGDDAREVKRVKFKLADKRQSLVDLAKLLGLWKEKADVEVKHSWHSVLSELKNGRG